MNLLQRATAIVAAMATSFLTLVGCDQQKINEL